MTQLTSNPFEIIEQRLESIEGILHEIKNEKKVLNPKSENLEEIGGIQLAEKITGLAKPTIYTLVSQSKIPNMKQGKRLYFSRQELTDWIRSGKRKTDSEKQGQVDKLLVHSKRKIKS